MTSVLQIQGTVLVVDSTVNQVLGIIFDAKRPEHAFALNTAILMESAERGMIPQHIEGMELHHRSIHGAGRHVWEYEEVFTKSEFKMHALKQLAKVILARAKKLFESDAFGTHEALQFNESPEAERERIQNRLNSTVLTILDPFPYQHNWAIEFETNSDEIAFALNRSIRYWTNNLGFGPLHQSCNEDASKEPSPSGNHLWEFSNLYENGREKLEAHLQCIQSKAGEILRQEQWALVNA